MSRESYVTFETVKLLRKKGFRGDCIAYYNDDGRRFLSLNAELHPLPCPTQAVACRWLREEHNILVTVLPCEVGAGVDDYTYAIYEIQPEDYHFKFIAQGRMQPVAYTMDYEGTLEEGIKHVLTNLI